MLNVRILMADLSINLAGIKSSNPFWVASGPPSNTAYQCHRAFEAGWGGVVWKTIGDPIVNVSSRYSALNAGTMRMLGFNNIELISDRSIETNFREIAEVKARWPERAVIASLMVDTRERWHEFMKRSADAGADGIFVPGLSEPSAIGAIVAEVKMPVNVMAYPGLPPAKELKKLGVQRLSSGTGIPQMIWSRAAELAESFLATGDSNPLFNNSMAYGKLQKLFTR